MSALQSTLKVISVIVLLTFSLSTLTVNAEQTATATVKSILNDIKTAETKLAKTQLRLSKEQAALSKKIFDKEQALTQLRKEAAIKRRLADEDTLSLNKLQTRLDTWQQQQQYQLNLLNRFAREQLSSDKNDQIPNDQKSLLAEVAKVITAQEVALYPQFTKQQIVLDNGVLTDADTLQVGPVAWFSASAESISGLLDLSDHEDIAKVAFIQTHSADNPLAGAIQALQSGTEKTVRAELTFDPSLTHVIASESQNENAYQHLKKGGLWVLPIMAFACFALVIALLKAIQLFRLAKIKQYSQAQLSQLFTQQKTDTFQGMQHVLFNLSVLNKKGNARDDQLFNQLTFDKHRLENWVGAIAITASVSPLLGLLGTVSGMIETFKMMTLFGSGDPEVVSGGIAQALITTELGLVVAIPALVLNALLSRKVKSYYTQLEAFAVQLSQLEKNDV